MYDACWLRRDLKTKIENTGKKGRDASNKKGIGNSDAVGEVPTPVEGEGLVPNTDEEASPGAVSYVAGAYR